MTKEVKYNYASFSQRLLAHNIDLIPILGLFYLTTLLPSSEVDLILLGSIYILYHVGFEMSHLRATPGKLWTKQQVHNISTKPEVISILIRNILKPFSLLLFFGGFAMINFNKKKQSLHDFIAGTVVLFEEEKA